MSTPTRIEDRLADLLGELAESTPLERDDVEFDPFRLAAVAASPARARRGYASLAVAAAAITTVVAGGVILAATRERTPDVGSPSASQPVGPRWFQFFGRHLPAEFEHIAVLGSHAQYVSFEALDIDTAKMLHITVSRGAMRPDSNPATMSLDDARSAKWTDPNAGYGVSLPDGRQIGVYCSIGPMPDGEPNCPAVNGVATNAEDLRRLVLAIADHLDPADLPPPSENLSHISAAAIRTAVAAATERIDDAHVEAPHYAFSFVQYGDLNASDLLSVRTVSGFLPAPEPAAQRRAATTNGRRATWQVMPDHSVWYVYDAPDAGLDLADQILDTAETPDPEPAPSGPEAATLP
ncbi:MAG TPA: hypothetical protein VNQ73_04630 [Ilumatobacter sp.]|nr:hypothetical protein [Ilumatobacter sp.]